VKATVPVLACPACGSNAVVYTCNPACCYNHVCDDCRTTFELETEYLGAEVAGVEPPEVELDACDPTAECVRCQRPTVYQAGVRFVCVSCLAALAIHFTEIAPP
jgi:hypothetical protein